MTACSQCGHDLSGGPFCGHCGHPVSPPTATSVDAPADSLADPLFDPLVDSLADPLTDPLTEPLLPDWRHGTSERPVITDPLPDQPAGPVRVPPTAAEMPAPPRFPLFADEVAGTMGPVESATVPASVDLEAGEVAPSHEAPAGTESDWNDGADDDWDDDWDEYSPRRRAPWIAGVAVLVGLLSFAAWNLGQSLAGADDAAPGDLIDRTGTATVTAPRTARPEQDVDGATVSFDAANMLDGSPETTWRAAGDGARLKIVFTFASRTELAEVGLINGYAKTSTDADGNEVDWYLGHRRVTEVTWNFGSGTIVRQPLNDTREMQTMAIERVEVRKVVLKIVSTSDPGIGDAGRDFTAISEVRLAG
jgi:hypothetical protein